MAGYLKCDADGCDHQEAVGPLTPEMIGKPCPKCGESLLTEQDYRDGKRAEELIEFLKELGIAVDKPSDQETAMKLSINPHKGDVNIKIRKAGE